MNRQPRRCPRPVPAALGPDRGQPGGHDRLDAGAADPAVLRPRARGHSRAIGQLIAAFSIAQLVAAPFWGRLSDRYGRRPALLIGLLASAIAYVVFGLAPPRCGCSSSPAWCRARAAGRPASPRPTWPTPSQPRERAKALGWLSAATYVGVMLGPVIGGLATQLGPRGPGLIAAALCLVNAWFAWRWLPESRGTAERLAHRSRKPVWHAAWQSCSATRPGRCRASSGSTASGCSPSRP